MHPTFASRFSPASSASFNASSMSDKSLTFSNFQAQSAAESLSKALTPQAPIAFSFLHPPPHIPAPNRSPRPPFFGDLDHLLRLRLAFQPIHLLKSLPHPQIIHRQQIGAIEHENQEHFRRPAA